MYWVCNSCNFYCRKYTSTSTANGSKITGEGKVTGGVTVVEGTTEGSKTIEADVKVTPKDEKTEVNGTTVAGTIAILAHEVAVKAVTTAQKLWNTIMSV